MDIQRLFNIMFYVIHQVQVILFNGVFLFSLFFAQSCLFQLQYTQKPGASEEMELELEYG
jgi:hypothetical protein